MQENKIPEDGSLDNSDQSLNNKSFNEISSAGIDSVEQTSETEEMEVHHHSTHTHGKKNWKSYFWEFLMLFLAVFCGFLAEYRLEHVIEGQREVKLMQTMTVDLENDAATLQTYIDWRMETNSDFDSILLLLSGPEAGDDARVVYALIQRSTLKFGLPDINTGTITQLTNAGGLRLVHSEMVTGAINKHYLAYNRMKSNYETERFLRLNLVESRADILDARLLDYKNTNAGLYSINNDEPLKVNRFVNDIIAARQLNMSLIKQLELFKTSTEDLRQVIMEEYEFD